jgi:hypothetical protein
LTNGQVEIEAFEVILANAAQVDVFFFRGHVWRNIDRGMLEVEPWGHLFCDLF